MKPLNEITFCLLSFSIASSASSLAQDRDRSKTPEKYKWDLTQIYPSDDDWRKEKEKVKVGIAKIEQYKGKLGESPANLYSCLDFVTNLRKEFSRLYGYASMSSDVDTRDSKRLELVQEMRQIGSDFSAKASFIDPEILEMDRTTVDDFLRREPKLATYRFYLDDVLRRKPHKGTAGEEKIIADASLMSGAPGSIYTVFSDADFPYPEVNLSDGKKVKLDKAAFNLYRTRPNREDRKKVFASFFGAINDFRRTFGTTLDATVKKDQFYARARKYNSALESSLDDDNIPVEVYRQLVKDVNANLPTFHRYLNLRKRMMGVDTLHYYDLYAPLVKSVELRYTVEESQKHILAALAPLGKDYVAVANKAFNDRWVDYYPNEGKRAGAYSTGAAYDVHPYMLLNYNGKYDDMSTLAHELGHTMHSYYSSKNQPYQLASYSIFVAEVASTFNEALLIDYMLREIKSDEVKLSLLGNYLEGIKGTVFRQTQFAEFELRAHEMAERGEPLTGDVLNKVYEEITRKYYGHDHGVCIVDDEIKIEWAFVPHFYRDFYVFQYATSYTASSALSEPVLAGDKAATERYLGLLAAGGSDYPVNLLKKAGVDMTTSQPIQLTMKKMNRVIDEMEKILDRMKK
jgi:oligoendopeptidase F